MFFNQWRPFCRHRFFARGNALFVLHAFVSALRHTFTERVDNTVCKKNLQIIRSGCTIAARHCHCILVQAPGLSNNRAANPFAPASAIAGRCAQRTRSRIVVIHMLNFFFRRFTRNRSNQKEISAEPPVEQSAQPESADLARSRLKSDALQNAAAFDRNEDAAVEFILQCGFADARLAAAQNIHSRPALEKVRRAMRDTDRRVAKLMQSRLDALERQRRNAEAATRCVGTAQALATNSQLAPNQVAQLERTWKALGELPEPQRSDFEAVHAVLTARLANQAALQRLAIDIGGQLRRMQMSLNGSPDAAALAEASAAADALTAEIAHFQSAPDAASLPTALVVACNEGLRGVKAMLEKAGARHTALSARDESLAKWNAIDIASIDVGALRKEWKDADPTNALQTDDDGKAAEQQQRLDALLKSVDAVRKPPLQAQTPAVQAVPSHDPSPAIKTPLPDPREVDAALAALDEALEQGSLRAALVQDRLLREMGAGAVRADGRGARLASARARLAQLKDWARWGGGVSREELLKRAQELPARETDPTVLAELVGDLRTRWKTLDTSAGPAPREQWDQFDAACNLAYEPAAAHFAAQAAARDANLANAGALTEEVIAFAAANGLAHNDSVEEAEPSPMLQPVDWKNVAQFCSRAVQRWQGLGTISRKEKKQAQDHFEAALRLLQEPLMREQHGSAQRREAMIAEVGAIDPLERGAFDSLRTLQQRWQGEAKAVPVSRITEQQFWQRFRDACDTLVARRRDRLDKADAGRRDNLEKCQALCATLEAAANASDMTDAATDLLLRETGRAWAQAGEVPRGTQQEIDERYLRAVDRLQARIDAAQRAVQDTQWQTLARRLSICRRAEQALFDERGVMAIDDAQRLEWANEWQLLPVLPNALQHALQRRFDAALAAHATGGDCSADVENLRGLLQANCDALKQELLRLEILAGAETPPAYQRERLRLQVDGLQSALKTGREAMTLGAQLQRLCGFPALTDDETAERIERALAAAKRSEPSAIGKA